MSDLKLTLEENKVCRQGLLILRETLHNDIKTLLDGRDMYYVTNVSDKIEVLKQVESTFRLLTDDIRNTDFGGKNE